MRREWHSWVEPKRGPGWPAPTTLFPGGSCGGYSASIYPDVQGVFGYSSVYS
jgi:hypothetical protein